MISKELIGASAKPLILSILASHESYGYEIIQRIKAVSNDEIQWKDGMLYPVLHRLEEQGLIRSRWRTSENGRERKYYSINKKGTEQLASEKQQWMMVHTVLEQLWRLRHA